ncbi:MAG: LacI family DNA-binding transcriptional regulator [Anaerolineae bacterium]|nr:LacI family DNA-binding transcriptional regulator [Anaerolineae bacterium]
MTQENQSTGNVTIVDVAREAGVSYSTVSRVVNNFKYVKPDTRERVEAAMDRLGYVANLKARSLAGGRSQVVGMLLYELDTSYHVEIVRGVDAEITNSEYDLMLSTTHKRRRKESAYVTQLTQGMVDGFLFVLPRYLEAYTEDLDRQQVPYVLIDHPGIDGIKSNTITATNWQGAYDATQYLIDLGHSRIGFITGTIEVASAQERLAGYQSAIRDNGFFVDPELICKGDFLEDSGYEAAKKFLSLAEPPTAIFASSDVSAFGAIRAIDEAGYLVPQDISVVGFDDVPESSYIRPRLTTVRQPLREMGQLATRMVLARIEDPTLPVEQVELPTVLIIRDTCQSPVDSKFMRAV